MDEMKDKVIGALIGLARATDGNEHLISDSATAVIMEGLISWEDHILEKIDTEKRRMVPGCFACASPCGRTAAFDLSELEKADEDVWFLKRQILKRLELLAASENVDQNLFYKGLIVVGMEDYSAEDLCPILQELDQAAANTISDAVKARAILESDGHTCVLKKGDAVQTSRFRGVRPLVQWLESGADLKGYCAADKVVGKATAYLYCLFGIRAVYAHVMSRSAREVLQRFGIIASYGQLAENIINRNGDGICPFEAAVLEIHEPQMARIAILRKMKEMNISL